MVSPIMGQKLTGNPKDKLIQVRMDKETVEKLDCLASEQNSDRSKIIRQGIEIQYEQRDKK
jgi:predicted transcriptional regulator